MSLLIACVVFAYWTAIMCKRLLNIFMLAANIGKHKSKKYSDFQGEAPMDTEETVLETTAQTGQRNEACDEGRARTRLLWRKDIQYSVQLSRQYNGEWLFCNKHMLIQGVISKALLYES